MPETTYVVQVRHIKRCPAKVCTVLRQLEPGKDCTADVCQLCLKSLQHQQDLSAADGHAGGADARPAV